MLCEYLLLCVDAFANSFTGTVRVKEIIRVVPYNLWSVPCKKPINQINKTLLSQKFISKVYSLKRSSVFLLILRKKCHGTAMTVYDWSLVAWTRKGTKVCQK